ncbi:MAG: hypothetical protein HN611_27045 [Gemmatimonadetes bacterium]|nr:hypothetical protein [Gemmatimonadota bacterium]
MLGPYGHGLRGCWEVSRGGCRFRRDEFKKIAPWRKKAIARTAVMIAEPDLGDKLKVKVEKAL